MKKTSFDFQKPIFFLPPYGFGLFRSCEYPAPLWAGRLHVNGVLVNEEILKAGWGRFHSDNVSVRGQLKTAYDKARENSLGIFSEKCRQMTNPDNPKCNIKGNIDKSTGDKIYYFPGCAQYDFTIVEKDWGEEWFCSEKEAAAAGFVKAKTCP